VHPSGELTDPFGVSRVAEEARPVRSDSGRLEPDDEWVSDEVGTTAQPLHSTVCLGQPERTVLLELVGRPHQVAVSTAVGRNDESMLE
jgi:hypothetical protein